MDMIRLQSGQLWYRKQLLAHRPARSFEDLLLVDSVNYESFSGAVTALGLLKTDSEAHICLKEAVDTLFDPNQIRSLFVLLDSDGAPAPELYDLYPMKMSEDYQYNNHMSD